MNYLPKTRNYSKSKNNVYNLTNEQINKLYELYTKIIVDPNGIGYLLHQPRTNYDLNNKDFFEDSVVNCANNCLKIINNVSNIDKLSCNDIMLLHVRLTHVKQENKVYKNHKYKTIY